MKIITILTGISVLVLTNPVFPQENIDHLILERHYGKALLFLDKKLEISPETELLIKKGQVLMKMQKYNEAVKVFRECLTAAPADPLAMNEMAEAFSALGNNADAADWFEVALRFDGNNLQLKSNLGRAYINLKEFGKACNQFDEIYHIDSSNVFWNKQLAYCCSKTGNADRAIYLYEKLIEQNPRDLSNYLNLANLYEQKKKYEQLISNLTAGLNQFPLNSELLLKLANHYYSTKFYEKAVDPYKMYIEKNKPDFNVLKNYGISLFFSKREFDAIAILEKCVELVVNDPYILFY